MPGFTHLQTAQPITFGHHMMAWFEMLERDRERLADCSSRVNVMPLAQPRWQAPPYPIDCHYSAQLLDSSALRKLADSVSDRDFAIEFSAAAALIMMHLSRMSEELIIWSSAQFSLLNCLTASVPILHNASEEESGCTGTDPGQERTHIRASHRLLTLMKSQPLAYNKDNQEDKEPLFDTVDNVKGSLKIFAAMIPAISCRRENMRAGGDEGVLPRPQIWPTTWCARVRPFATPMKSWAKRFRAS